MIQTQVHGLEFTFSVESPEHATIEVETSVEPLASWANTYLLRYRVRSTTGESFTLSDLSIRWSVPAIDMHGLYAGPPSPEEFTKLPFWRFQKQSAANTGFPFISLFHRGGENRFAFGLMDQVTETALDATLFEATRAYHFRWRRYIIPLMIALLALLPLAVPANVYADSPAPVRDYTKTTESGQYIFVMLGRSEPSAYNQRGYVVQDAPIRQKYTQSGLYKNDGSTTPLWTVDWYAFGVEVSSDGHHLVKYGPWPFGGNYTELALAFYENGQETQSYRVDQLVAIPPLLPHSVSHYQWVRHAEFNDGQSRLVIETELGEKYSFDVTTGKPAQGIILPWPRCLNFLVVLAVGWLGIFMVYTKRKNSRSATRSVESEESYS